MDRRWAQDVLRCHLCKTPSPPMYCDICNKYMCKICVEEHLSDESKEHIVVPLEKRGLTTKCSKHSSQLCDIYCEQCDIPFCVECVSYGEHLGHKHVGILKILETKKEALQRDLQEFEKIILPKYQEIASNITVQKAELKENSQKQTKAIIKHGEDMHQEIDTAIKRMKADLNEMDSNNLVFLNKQEDYLKTTISVIMQSIDKLNKLLNSNDVSIVSAYKCRNDEFRRLPPKRTIPLPSFTHPEINKEQICQQFGSLSAFPTKSEERDFSDTESSSPDRPLDEPRITANIKTAYTALNRVSCLSDEQIWTCGNTNIMTLYNLHGDVVKTIQTKSGRKPSDIAVTMSGDLVYADTFNRTVNIVKNTQIQEQVRLRGWRPSSICSSFSISGDLLAILISDDDKQVKVVRYSGSTEKQVIQYDDKGQRLYFSRYYHEISENRNLDICVSDCGPKAGVVVVVNLAGKLRFIYTGFPSTTEESFDPRGITTDSHGQILIADLNNSHIHIIDIDGQFLRYIDNCVLVDPFVLCVDTRDNLFVTEYRTTRVKKVNYYYDK